MNALELEIRQFNGDPIELNVDSYGFEMDLITERSLWSKERNDVTDTDATSHISNIPPAELDGDQILNISVQESAGVQSSRNRAPYQEPEVPQAVPRRETQTNYENV